MDVYEELAVFVADIVTKRWLNRRKTKATKTGERVNNNDGVRLGCSGGNISCCDVDMDDSVGVKSIVDN